MDKITELEQELIKCQEKITEAVKNRDYEYMAWLRNEIKLIKEQIENLKSKKK